ncbi:type i phosphodiesterase/nucleotide pyrophosphatase family protein [Neobacillus bataviensis LMG 21833]|uniref:Type i phosphodiesterase/nucleotide pyrophosphatase family protein n=1 Tax=Neobacillus bataviensis LMG 21833 TaxID=1117379 RepID=K6DXU6_9BACI|nr:ectonucleotide pyrophosphatase/phosphodiesterase [Neobacillus bataviensis]EKN65681.1 type i phosphodiesterase/nucleotide pyrophosphatase family protein [Neobacillus bataviensis LMG 21833]
MTRLTNHLIIISFDCLSALDYPILKDLPHFQTILKNGTYVEKVETIYPSVTYPCHATIVTGNYPNRHGVINNTLLQPGNPSPDWNWYRDCIHGTTLYDEAKLANLTTAALLWPVTGKANIDYNMPEIFANRPWQNQILVSLMNGTPSFQLELNKCFGHIRKGLKQPELDDFVLESTVHTIKTKKPNLVMVHFTDLDTQRHEHGFSSTEAIAAIHRHNLRLGRILEAIYEAGIYENSTVVALGDHSALDENKAVNLNVLLHKKNFITTNAKGKVINWLAYCKSCDGSAYIYINDKQDSATIKEVKQLVDSLLDDPDSGIEQVLTGDQAAAKGADGSCAFMLEASHGYYFLEDIEGEYIKTISREDAAADKKYTLACHGYSPEKEDYGTILMAVGKGINQTTLPSIRLIDEGPTFARLLGVSLGNTDGRVVEEMLTI